MNADYEKGYADGFKAGLAIARSPLPDRARRIRELVREWVGRGLEANPRGRGFAVSDINDVLFFTKEAARLIDALDAAVIPPKSSVERVDELEKLREENKRLREELATVPVEFEPEEGEMDYVEDDDLPPKGEGK